MRTVVDTVMLDLFRFPVDADSLSLSGWCWSFRSPVDVALCDKIPDDTFVEVAVGRSVVEKPLAVDDSADSVDDSADSVDDSADSVDDSADFVDDSADSDDDSADSDDDSADD